ncbi:MAG: DNA polymerase III subunit beta [Dehalococcoidales bacterium]|nr:DNA polymerase III subunit beta [Dehalococcoidales bacterium]
MKLTVTQENLSKGLTIIGRAVSTKSTIPILANVLLEANETSLKLTANNLEMAIACQLPASIEELGTITLPAQLFSRFVNSLPTGDVAMSLNEKTLAMHVQAGKARADIKGLNADDFPPMPDIEAGVLCDLPAKGLKDAISCVAWAASDNEIARPVLGCVYMEFKDDALTLAAADGYVLAEKRVKLSQPAVTPIIALIPKSLAGEVAKVCEGSEPVRITVKGGQISFQVGRVTLVARLVAGTFPNFHQIIPANCSTRAIADVAETIKAVRMVTLFAPSVSDDFSRLTKWFVADSQITIRAVSAEQGESEASVEVSQDGPDVMIGLDGRFMLSALNAVPVAKFELGLNSPTMAALLRGADDDTWQAVIMPMHVK